MSRTDYFEGRKKNERNRSSNTSSDVDLWKCGCGQTAVFAAIATDNIPESLLSQIVVTSDNVAYITRIHFPNKQSSGSIYWRSNATDGYMPIDGMVCFCIRLLHSFRARNDRANQRHGKGSIGSRSAGCRDHCDPNRDGSKKNCRHERNR